MEELEIEGKKYLSSRKAAREHRYHIDYVGQLIRAGKVHGKKVGRSWYVEEASLKNYLLLEAGQKAPQAPVVEEVVEEKIIEPVVAVVEEAPVIAEPAPVPVELERIIPAIKPVERIYEEPVRVVQMHTPVQKTTLTYIEDSEPLLPVLEGRARSNADFVSVPLRREVEEEIEEEQEPISYRTPVVTVHKKGRMPLAFPRVQTIALVAFVVLAVAVAASGLLSTSIKVKEGQPASIIYGIK